MAGIAEQITACVEGGTGVIWVASSSLGGEPHLALSTELTMLDEKTVQLTSFCCLNTVDNLRDNPRVAIGVWSKKLDEGWQIVGTPTAVDVSPVEGATCPDAVQYTLTLTIDEALHLVPGQHSDSAV